MAHSLQKQLGGTDLHYVHLLVYYYLKSKVFSAVNFLHSEKGLPGNIQLSVGLLQILLRQFCLVISSKFIFLVVIKCSVLVKTFLSMFHLCPLIPVVSQSVAMGPSAVQQNEGWFPRDEKLVSDAQNPSSGS